MLAVWGEFWKNGRLTMAFQSYRKLSGTGHFRKQKTMKSPPQIWRRHMSTYSYSLVRKWGRTPSQEPFRHSPTCHGGLSVGVMARDRQRDNTGWEGRIGKSTPCSLLQKLSLLQVPPHLEIPFAGALADHRAVILQKSEGIPEGERTVLKIWSLFVSGCSISRSLGVWLLWLIFFI